MIRNNLIENKLINQLSRFLQIFFCLGEVPMFFGSDGFGNGEC